MADDDTLMPPPTFKMPNAKDRQDNKGKGVVVDDISKLPKNVYGLLHFKKNEEDELYEKEALEEQKAEQERAKKARNVQLKYTEPIWSSEPKLPYSFEVLRNGNVIDTIDLGKQPFYLFGRAPVCDISLQHQSISRQHAIVQHRGSTDACYLHDLGSTHGTYINKQKLGKGAYIQMFTGDVIKFGNGSSRLYIVCGGLEREQPKTQDEMEEDELEEGKELSGDAADRILARIEERSRPEQPKDQEKDKKEDKDEDEFGLEDMGGNVVEYGDYATMYGDDDDDFYDRTDATARKKKRRKERNKKQEVETYSTLLSKKNMLMKEMEYLTKEIDALAEVSKKTDAEGNEAADIDTFMDGVHEEANKERIKKKEKLLSEFSKELEKTEVLIMVVKPALEPLHHKHTKREKRQLEAFSINLKKRKKETEVGEVELHRSKKRKTAVKQTKPKRTFKRTFASAPKTQPKFAPAPKEKPSPVPTKEIKVVEKKVEEVKENKDNMEVDDKPKKEIYGPALYPDRSAIPKKKKKRRKKKKEETWTDEHNYEEWVPPQNQSGDGKTSLNAKLGY